MKKTTVVLIGLAENCRRNVSRNTVSGITIVKVEAIKAMKMNRLSSTEPRTTSFVIYDRNSKGEGNVLLEQVLFYPKPVIRYVGRKGCE